MRASDWDCWYGFSFLVRLYGELTTICVLATGSLVRFLFLVRLYGELTTICVLATGIAGTVSRFLFAYMVNSQPTRNQKPETRNISRPPGREIDLVE